MRINIKTNKTFPFTIDNIVYDINIDYLLNKDTIIDYYNLFINKYYGNNMKCDYLIKSYWILFDLIIHDNYEISIMKFTIKKLLL